MGRRREREEGVDSMRSTPILSTSPWRQLEAFRDPSVAKLYNLRLASCAGLDVPLTFWDWAAELEQGYRAGVPRPARLTLPCIVRSGSPSEDTCTTSNAGQFLSVVVRGGSEFARGVSRVIEALPLLGGERQGVVFVQPLVRGSAAGVTFFDGFYFEETRAQGTNLALTSGRARGEVARGHLQRGSAHSEWLRRVYSQFGTSIDIEWAEPNGGQEATSRRVLQVRPVLFPLRRAETLSLANHKEVFGDPPSPWTAGALAAVGRPVMQSLEALEPEVARWNETYCAELGGRVWLNLSMFFRLMDHWGLPRSMVTECVGGQSAGPDDDQFVPRRFVRKLPTMAYAGVASCYHMLQIPRGLQKLDAELRAAHGLQDLQRLTVRALQFSVETNIAILLVLSVTARMRKRLGLDQAARVVTHRMMARYAWLASRPRLADRLAELDKWLKKYGHRGPLESDLWRPRFAELRGVLRAAVARGPAPAPPSRHQPSLLLALLGRPLFLSDEVREWFRDRLMRIWQRLRQRILAESQEAVEQGYLRAPEDVFFLRAEDLADEPSTWPARVEERKAAWARARQWNLPATASRDTIDDAIGRQPRSSPARPAGDRYTGIGLGSTPVSGTAVLARDLRPLLEGNALPKSPILVAVTLEPSWALVFPRFAAVVADLGGELSHAAILLREAGIPAVVNAQGAFQGITDGAQIRVDPGRGEVVVESQVNPVSLPGAGSALAC